MSVRELRRALLARYGETQARAANPSVYDDLESFWPYYTTNYASLIADVPTAADILEIGSGHGSLLAWLRHRGFREVTGVDASPGEVCLANERLGGPFVVCDDALTYLEAHPQEYDVVFAKAIVEHIPREDLLRLVRALAGTLRPNGLAIVDVPNMDWLAASHERYMDLTHEVGFTRESLETFLSLSFDEVVVVGSTLARPTRSQKLLRPLFVKLLRGLLYVIGEGAHEVLFSSRSLIAVVRGPRTR